jgi:hypothetical protein
MFFLSGCFSATSLKTVHDNFSEAYGEAMNHQLLMNLARLSQGEPAYFIQLGAFSTQVGFTADATLANSTYTKSSQPISTTSGFQRALTLGGGVDAGITDSPTFNFVPLTGDLFAKELLKTITPDTLRDFYKSGYHADVLFRIMVQDIEIKSADGAVTTLVNHPGAETYPEFLAFCRELRIAQIHQQVSVGLSDDAPQKQLTLQLAGPGHEEYTLQQILTDSLVSVTDASSVPDKVLQIDLIPTSDPTENKLANAKLKLKKAEAILTEDQAMLEASLLPQDPKAADLLKPIQTQLESAYATDLKAVNDAQTTVRCAAQEHKDFKAVYPDNGLLTDTLKPDNDSIVTYHLRTFEGIMYGAANEEQYFLDHHNTKYSTPDYNIIFSSDGLSAEVKCKDISFQCYPILTLRTYGYKLPLHPLDTYTDRNHIDYAIGNPVGKEDELNEHEFPLGNTPSMTNQNIFSLIAYLFGKTMLEPDKLPIQQLIQIH